MCAQVQVKTWCKRRVREGNTGNNMQEKGWAEHMMWDGAGEQDEADKQPIWDMIQLWPTHSVQSSLRIPFLFPIPLQVFTTSTLYIHGAADKDTSCPDSHNGTTVWYGTTIVISRRACKSLFLTGISFPPQRFGTDISLEGPYMRNKLHWFKFAKCYYNYISPKPSTRLQDISSFLLRITETLFKQSLLSLHTEKHTQG